MWCSVWVSGEKHRGKEGERGRRERERARVVDGETKREEGRLLQQTGVRSSCKFKVSSV